MLSRYFIERVLIICISSMLMYYITLQLLEKTNGLDLDFSDNSLKKIENKINSKLNLNLHEKSLLKSIIYPEDINTSLLDIGGHESIKTTLNKVLFKPLETKSNLKGPLFAPPNGIILHGHPGTGKTMFAKAIAKRVNGVFISCDPASFENKFYGESSKLIKSLFSLANKINPCVIFIDEIDGILGKRNDLDQSFINEVKTIFLAEMDGITEKSPNVIFIGATNKLNSIDKAVKRRMRLHIEVPLPDLESRKKILNIHLGKYKIDLDQISKDTEGFSGSDLFELCKLSGLESISDNRDKILLKDIQFAFNQLKI